MYDYDDIYTVIEDCPSEEDLDASLYSQYITEQFFCHDDAFPTFEEYKNFVYGTIEK